MNALNHKIFISVFLFTAFFALAGTADAAVLRMKPLQADVTVGNIVNVQVTVDTLGKIINNAESIIQFPTDLLEVVSINSASSIFSLWVENPSFSNTAGQVTFNGGVPNPGFQGSAGNIVSIVFRAKKAGTASVMFSDSAVRENDGFGTDILSSKTGSEITIRSGQAQPVVQPVAPPSNTDALTIKSATHPNQDAWYSNDTPQFSWNLSRSALEVRTLIGKEPASVPNVSYTPAISSKTVSNLPDGTYYFSLRERTSGGWSSTSRFKVNIDTVTPDPFSISILPLDPQKGVQAKFSTTDELSGIDHYDLLVNGVTLSTITEEEAGGAISVPSTTAGTSTLTVIAYDKAGNTTSASEVYVAIGSSLSDTPTTPTSNRTFAISYDTLFSAGWIFINYFSVLLVIMSILGSIGFVGWYLWHRVHKVRRTLLRRIAATDKVLHAELIEIHKALQDEVERLETEGSARELTSEEKRILKRFSKLVEKTRHAMAEEFSRGR